MPPTLSQKNQKLLESYSTVKQTTMKFAALASLSVVLASALGSGAEVTPLRGSSIRSQVLHIFRRFLTFAHLDLRTNRLLVCNSLRSRRVKPALLRYAKRSEMLIVYIVSFLKAFAFAGVVKQGKDAAVLAPTTTRETSIRPAFAGPSRLILSSERAKMQRAALLGKYAIRNGRTTAVTDVCL